jgi:hypothetical protein
VCLLTSEGSIISEHGCEVDPDAWPEGYRAWCDYDTARSLVSAGQGEALCWNSEEIRWRHRRFEEGWKNRPSDVAVLRVPFGAEHERTLGALARWRDWLARYGASPTGTTGSAAWSLLRATLTDVLFCSFGELPPLLQTLGGRIEVGPAGPGRFAGRLAQVDLQAAYAHELASLRYGGRWFTGSQLAASGVHCTPEWWARDAQCPVFVAAKVRVPQGLYGPLVRRPRQRMSQLQLYLAQLYEDRYPTGTTLQGVWTWQEVAAAELGGAKVLQLREFWVQQAARRPFTEWWAAVEEGRKLPGLAGLLAKMTGNALWGRFCMDARAQGVRSVRSRNGKLASRPLPLRGGLPPAHDLAETVSGRVRAELYRLMAAAGAEVISAHTDGAWLATEPLWPSGIEAGVFTAADWRIKQPARRLDMLDPQTLRYWPTPARPWEPAVVYAGQPAGLAAAAFERAWQKAALP